MATRKIAESRHQNMLSDVIAVPPQIESIKFRRQRMRGKSGWRASHPIRTIEINRTGRVQDMANKPIGAQKSGHTFVPGKEISLGSEKRNMRNSR